MNPFAFKSFFEIASGKNIMIDPEFKIIAVSNDYLNACNSVKEIIIGKNIFEVFPCHQNNQENEYSNYLKATLKNVLEQQAACEMNVLNHLINCENGEIKNVFWKPNIKPILNQSNQIECIILHFDDVTEQIISNHKTDKLNNLHLFLSKLNQNILREQNENLLFKNACKFALDYGKFAMAWVGLFDKDEHVINLVEQNGIPDEDLKHFYAVKTDEYELQKQEIETGKYFVCNHIKEDTEQDDWKPFYFKNNILSYMVFPLIKTGKIIGSLNLYSQEKNYFNQEEITLLTEIVNNICFELDNIEKQKKQKETEAILIKNEKQFRALIEKSSDMKTLSNSEGKFIYGSPSITKILGYELHEFIGKQFVNFVHSSSIQSLSENIELILQIPGSSFNFQYQLLHKNGEPIWCEGTVTNMLHDKSIQAYVSNFVDISEKKLAEQQKEFDENNLNALINNTNDLMWSIDNNYNLITFNHAFEKIIKQISGETLIKGNSIFTPKIPIEHVKKYKTYFEFALSGQAFVEIEHLTTPFERWSEVCFFPIIQNGIVTGTACYAHDITNQKKAELERIQITNDLIQRNKDLEQFSYIVSHNLRAPVANIIGLSEAIQDKSLSEEVTSQVIDGLNISVKKLDEVIVDLNNILQTKRDINEKKETVNFSDLLNDISLSIFKIIEKENAILTWDFSEINEMLTLKSYLQSIFYNLVSNSLKYRQPTVPLKIELKSYAQPGKIKIIFKDNGIGIDLKKRGDQVFGLYKRFHPEAAEGKGLGLFMVKTQVETIGGKISVESEVNKGTTFTLVFNI